MLLIRLITWIDKELVHTKYNLQRYFKKLLDSICARPCLPFSLLSLLLSLSPLDSVVTLANVLHRASGSAVLTRQVLQASALVTRHRRVQSAAISAEHVQLLILLVYTSDVLVLEARLEDHVVL